MFRSHTTPSPTDGPVVTNWTTRELLEWIAADDARSLDASLVTVLTAIDRALDRDAATPAPVPAPAALVPASPAPLVRALAARLRRDPALRAVRVGDLIGASDPAPSAAVHAPRREAKAAVAASARPPRLRTT